MGRDRKEIVVIIGKADLLYVSLCGAACAFAFQSIGKEQLTSNCANSIFPESAFLFPPNAAFVRPGTYGILLYTAPARQAPHSCPPGPSGIPLYSAPARQAPHSCPPGPSGIPLYSAPARQVPHPCPREPNGVFPMLPCCFLYSGCMSF